MTNKYKTFLKKILHKNSSIATQYITHELSILEFILAII
jgi:hypothetical protein